MSYLRSRTASRAEAEDLFQETFLRVWKTPPAKGTPVDFYVLAVARNLAVSGYRRRTLELRNWETLLPKAEGAPGGDPAGHEEVLRLRAALARLPGELREVAVLKTQADLSWEQVGKLMGFSADTAARRYAEALAALRKELEP